MQSSPLVLFPFYPFNPDPKKRTIFMERQRAAELENSLRELCPAIFTGETCDLKELEAILKVELGIQDTEKLSMVEVLYLLKHRKTKAFAGGRSIDSQNKPEDIIELKPNFFGFGLNINALIRRIKGWIKKKST